MEEELNYCTKCGRSSHDKRNCRNKTPTCTWKACSAEGHHRFKCQKRRGLKCRKCLVFGHVTKWCKTGDFCYICDMAYDNSHHRFGECVKTQKLLAEKKRVIAEKAQQHKDPHIYTTGATNSMLEKFYEMSEIYQEDNYS